MKLDEICRVLEGIAPLHLAQSWDNVGLLAGDPQAECTSISLAIDLTAAVLEEAIEHKHDLMLAYHPPLFKPISSLRADSSGTDAIVWKAIR
ncbi:MAG: Nif3-like dinuclear metal center hexameric protein, partial [Planctomycetes bacterium]|nr:Nif3-like dinuclear metal center hexameric protein [Planctomycetota bacterium]